MSIPAARYKGKYIPGSLQTGFTKTDKPQISVDLQIPPGVVTCFLVCTEAAQPYTDGKLIALGWEGKGHPLDDASLTNEVEVDVSYETYQGREKMGVDIVAGGGRAKMKKEMDAAQKADFMARLTGVAPGAAKPTDKIPF